MPLPPAPADAPDEADVLVPGPWTHRYVSANGIRFHAVEAGVGPLVVLLHGFPEFWWSWRHVLPGLARQGYRVVAVDLRGYGATDKPPTGYDLYSLAGDVGRLVRALGEQRAHVVGHDWGGVLAWTAATLHPSQVAGVVALEMPHPLRLRATFLRGDQRARLAYVRKFQVPGYGERMLTADRGAWVGELVREWSGAEWAGTDDFAEAVVRYRDAIRIPGVAQSALGYYRWAVRSLLRPTGAHLAHLLERGITCPTLQVHSTAGGPLLLSTARGSEAYVHAPYRLEVLDGPGHFLPEEAPDAVVGLVGEFLADARGAGAAG